MNDGGPAFPTVPMATIASASTPDSARPVFIEAVDRVSGMSLRDYFAAKALPIIIKEHYWRIDDAMLTKDEIAEAAYDYADAMLEAREAK